MGRNECVEVDPKVSFEERTGPPPLLPPPFLSLREDTTRETKVETLVHGVCYLFPITPLSFCIFHPKR